MKSRGLALLSVIAILLSTVAPIAARPAAADINLAQRPAQVVAAAPSDSEGDEVPRFHPSALAKNAGPRNQHKVTGVVVGGEGLNPAEMAVFIVQLASPPLPSYAGHLPDLPATAPRVTGARKLDTGSAASVAYRSYLVDRQAVVKRRAEQVLGRPLQVRFDYQAALNGFAAEMTPVEAVQVAKLDGVLRVIADWVEYVQTDVGPEWVGADAIWNGSATGGVGTRGEGVVVGIIDTGINSDHPSFAVMDGDGYIHTNPRGQFYGWCDPLHPDYDSSVRCNNKLIGLWSGDEDGPEDFYGHGSHTGSTVAGNVIYNAVISAPTTVITVAKVSGVAPRANVIGYNIEATPGTGSAFGSVILAATEQAIDDQVDVINYSFGGGGANPWISAQHWLNLRDAGVFVATSAGNSGPTPDTVGSPANAPWVLSVGASSHDRAFSNALIDMAGGDTAPPADIFGEGLTGALAPAEIVYAGTVSVTNVGCDLPYPPNTFDGEIVVCDHNLGPQYAGRVNKSVNLKNAGAGGFVMITDESYGIALMVDSYALPGMGISYADGEALKTWLASGSSHMAAVRGVASEAVPGDVMAAFSSRGPNGPAPDIIKPDVTAPGRRIVAAVQTNPANLTAPPEFDVFQGTSMSSPHAAGAAALVKVAHPGWSAAQIQSALMATAPYSTTLKEDGTTQADPFDMGAGRIDVSQAVQAGFVLDESTGNFEAANPAAGGDPTMLNLASLANSQCVGLCTWTRTVSSTLGSPMEWNVTVTDPMSVTLTVEPSTFTLPAGGTQTVVITANVGSAPFGEWQFGRVTFTPASLVAAAAHFPTAHFPVAVKSVAAKVPASMPEITVETRRNAGVYTIPGLQAIDTDTLATTVFVGDSTTVEGSLAEDPTNDDPYDLAAGGVYTRTVEVPAGAKRLAVEILASTAPDLDLFVGIDSNSNGHPDASEELCRSTTASWDEVCVLPAPGETLQTGIYWVLVQNWQGSEASTDDFTLSTTLVTDQVSATMAVTGPGEAQLGAPFDLQFAWDFDDLMPGQKRYGLIQVDALAGGQGDVALLPVTVSRLADDVTVTSNVPASQYVEPGDIVTYTVRIRPELLQTGQTSYTATVTLPDGMTYVADSATGSPAVNGNQLTWSVDMDLGRQYVMSTSDTDPLCDTGFGGYVNLANFGINARPGIAGDGVTYSLDQFFGSDTMYNFFGTDYPQLYFTDDGLAFPGSTFGSFPGVNSGNNVDIPDPADPNNLIAPFWSDMRIVYDQATNRGVSIAGAGGDALMILEYDGLEQADNSANRLDVELVMLRQVDDSAGSYEIVFAYDNISGTLPSATVGLENADGSAGVAYEDELEDGLMICFDWKADESAFTYQATVDADVELDSTLVTQVDHALSAPGTKPATGRDRGVFVSGVALEIDLDGPSTVASGPITYTLTVTNRGVGPAANLLVRTTVPPGTEHLSGGTSAGNVVTWTVASLASGASAQVQMVVNPTVFSAASAVAAGTGNVAPSDISIVGGREAEPGAWPWQVALMQAGIANGFNAQFCGGSLIARNWVLTAAHCVTDENGVPLSPADLDATVGRHRLSTQEGQRVAVSEIVVHPAYDPESFDNDMALLRLAGPATLIPTVQTVDLAGPAHGERFTAGVLATVTGWGDRGEGAGDYADALYQVTVPVLSQEVCRFPYAAVGTSITDNMICAGYPEGGKDACQGDSGGPLVVPNGNGGWLQAGVVSWGIGCARPGLPGVYARVANYGDWIEQAGHTYRTGPFSVSDGTGKPGHSAAGSESITTLVGLFDDLFLPLVNR